MLRFSSLGQTAEKSMLKEEGFVSLMVSGVISHQGSWVMAGWLYCFSVVN